MKYDDPRNLSAWSALYVTGIGLLVYLFTSLSTDTFHWVVFTGIAVGLLIFTYLLSRTVLEKFIFEKIRPIYKTILTRRSTSDEIRGEGGKESRSDMIERVSQRVKEWDQEKSAEIAQLKRLEAYRREYIGNISHELKTPIFNIQGYVLTLLDGGLDDPNINRDYLLKTEKSIERMITIVKDLEMISKLESGQLKLEISRFDIITLSKEVIEFLDDKARTRKVGLKLSRGFEKPIFVYADRDRIRQVLTNLVDNSVVYGRKKGSTTIGFFDMDDHVLVEVTDDGEGIAAEELPRLFERFYRTDKARSTETGGSGLGLAIVKHIIEAHDERINVRSSIGVGTTFGFTLPKVP
ncbi:MAG TPA: ATP-binding protein [Bacteroidales bacterium]|nr:ATP-binding protein [Bacteroidales bacterium]